MARVVQKSFNGGEVTPAIHARNNLQKYESSLARLKNGFVHIEGCVSNRQGTEFVTVGKYPQKKIRLIPFKFNNEQTYMIEAGDKYFRFCLLTKKQCEATFKLVAELCKKYNIKVSPQTVMTHYEFGQQNKKTSSYGKIDITYLPPYPDIKPQDCGTFIRTKVNWYYKR